jgi:hypothetical protein
MFSRFDFVQCNDCGLAPNQMRLTERWIKPQMVNVPASATKDFLLPKGEG